MRYTSELIAPEKSFHSQVAYCGSAYADFSGLNVYAYLQIHLLIP